MKICAILDNFEAGEEFCMKTDKNKIPLSCFAMFLNPSKTDPKMAKIKLLFFPPKNNS